MVTVAACPAPFHTTRAQRGFDEHGICGGHSVDRWSRCGRGHHVGQDTYLLDEAVGRRDCAQRCQGQGELYRLDGAPCARRGERGCTERKRPRISRRGLLYTLAARCPVALLYASSGDWWTD